MATIGKMGAAQRPPRPGSAALNEALGLLSAFGGGDPDLRKLLTEMRDVQVANEALIETATAAVAEANAREASAQDAEAKARAALEGVGARAAEAQNLLNTRSAELEAREANLSGWASDLKAAEDSANADLKRREAILKEGEDQLAKDRATVDADMIAAADARAGAEAIKAEVQARLDRIAAAATGA